MGFAYKIHISMDTSKAECQLFPLTFCWWQVLGERDVYERYYRKQRAQQCSLSLSPPANMAEEVEGYRQGLPLVSS